jgi:hypothetical protein
MADNPRAFPNPGTDYSRGRLGMTLRDYFAGQIVGHIIERVLHADGVSSELGPAVCAKVAYQIADAMLEERKE